MNNQNQERNREALSFPRLLKPDDVAEALGVSRVQVYRWVRSGRLECVRLGSRIIRFRGDQVEKAMREGL